MTDLGSNVVRFRIPSSSLRYHEIKKFTAEGGGYEVVLTRLEGDSTHVHLLIIGDHWIEPIKSFVDAPEAMPLIELIADCCDTAAFAAINYAE